MSKRRVVASNRRPRRDQAVATQMSSTGPAISCGRATAERAVFVWHQAPHDQPLGIHAIRMVVRRAFRRAGIPHERTHALRHTLACRLVRGGSPIKEVADVLRHRSLNMSRIYAKLNVGALVELALPWPGSAS